MSVAASDTLFGVDSGDHETRASEPNSYGSVGFPGDDVTPDPSVVHSALAHLRLDGPQAPEVSESAFCKQQWAVPASAVRPSSEYVKQLHACWTDTKALSWLMSDGRTIWLGSHVRSRASHCLLDCVTG